MSAPTGVGCAAPTRRRCGRTASPSIWSVPHGRRQATWSRLQLRAIDRPLGTRRSRPGEVRSRCVTRSVMLPTAERQALILRYFADLSGAGHRGGNALPREHREDPHAARYSKRCVRAGCSTTRSTSTTSLATTRRSDDHRRTHVAARQRPRHQTRAPDIDGAMPAPHGCDGSADADPSVLAAVVVLALVTGVLALGAWRRRRRGDRARNPNQAVPAVPDGWKTITGEPSISMAVPAGVELVRLRRDRCRRDATCRRHVCRSA